MFNSINTPDDQDPEPSTATPKTKLEWALEHAGRGFGVFPTCWTDEDGRCSCGDEHCDRQGKHPLKHSHGYKDATRDPDESRNCGPRTPMPTSASTPERIM